ncbi:Methylcrotonoyl-CoA carboxylase beta chain, mitochondrial [Chlamydiales bacterium SCGC AG-110-P3]|nr:Methylcrotonoyl-CoA carboxylase beta chain, mitochondrial [Chlamydiales bacterium SCGC AG-110-P3]
MVKRLLINSSILTGSRLQEWRYIPRPLYSERSIATSPPSMAMPVHLATTSPSPSTTFKWHRILLNAVYRACSTNAIARLKASQISFVVWTVENNTRRFSMKTMTHPHDDTDNLAKKIRKKAKESAMPSSELKALAEAFLEEETILRKGGGEKGRARQKRHGRLAVRERIELLLDDPSDFLEGGLWAAYGMYSEWGDLPAAGVITGIGTVSDRKCMIIGNDATVKAGAMFPQSIKKLLRAQRVAYECRLPILYLVDSSGVFLPMQDEIFPDEDDFGRIFRNNSVLSAAGIPQYAAVMGNCIAGGAYLPVLCDKLLMTEGSGLYLAGPALVKAAIGQEIEAEELGGAEMHATVSGTVDFHEPDDNACIKRLRSLVALLPGDSATPDPAAPELPCDTIYDLVGVDGRKPYDARHLLAAIVDKDSASEYKADYGQSLICSYAQIDNQPIGIVASQRLQTLSKNTGVEIGGVIYAESADKAARFVMDCNQMRIPIIFLQDVMGFMVGPQAERAGIIRSGAKLVSAVSNCIVPKITVVVGNSFGAGNYALCGKAYDPNFIIAWPNAQYAVMGADQAAGTVFTIQKNAAERSGKTLKDEELEELYAEIKSRYEEQTDIRYGAARGWIDAIIPPHTTRGVLSQLIHLVNRAPLRDAKDFHTGVLQV